MRQAPNDSTRDTWAAARRFLADLREPAALVGQPGWVSVTDLVKRAAQDATVKANEWPTRSGRHRFLVELAGEVRSEWMAQADGEAPRSQFYTTLRGRIDELAEAERSLT